MKWLIVSCLLLASHFSAQAEIIMRDYYYVQSDVESDTVAVGRCIVKGRVTDPDTGEGVKGGIVANLNRSSYAVTDDSGYYQINIPATDTTVFFYHKKYEEIVCWKYNFKSQHVVTMNFVSSEKLPEGVFREAEKPVIYLYPETTTKIEVELDEDIELTTTYPLYHDSWKVLVHSDGTIEANGKRYPYLFWEGQKQGLYLIKGEGKYVGQSINTDSTIQFLEHTLSSLGLNNQESADFITYWGPRITKYPYANIQFHIDEDYTTMIGEMKITPEPDVTRRVYIVFKGFQDYPEAHNFPILADPIQRKGFVLIEWGGTEVTDPVRP